MFKEKEDVFLFNTNFHELPINFSLIIINNSRSLLKWAGI